MRFLLDNVHASVNYPFQSQFGKFVNAYPTSMQKFLGASTAAKMNPGDSETAGSLFTPIRAVEPLARIPAAVRSRLCYVEAPLGEGLQCHRAP